MTITARASGPAWRSLAGRCRCCAAACEARHAAQGRTSVCHRIRSRFGSRPRHGRRARWSRSTGASSCTIAKTGTPIQGGQGRIFATSKDRKTIANGLEETGRAGHVPHQPHVRHRRDVGDGAASSAATPPCRCSAREDWTQDILSADEPGDFTTPASTHSPTASRVRPTTTEEEETLIVRHFHRTSLSTRRGAGVGGPVFPGPRACHERQRPARHGASAERLARCG